MIGLIAVTANVAYNALRFMRHDLSAVASPAFAVGKGKAVYIGGTITGIKERPKRRSTSRAKLPDMYRRADALRQQFAWFVHIVSRLRC